jgi:type III secretion protein U
MAKQKGGDQTERPTPKRLKDARKEGEVHKSRELTSTVLVLAWLLMAWLLLPFVSGRLAALFEASLRAIADPHGLPPAHLLSFAAYSLLWLSLPFLIAACLIAILVEFLQVGPVFAPKRLVPKMERMNPAEGVKRLFSQENLVEVVKSMFKTAALIAVLCLVLRRMLGDMLSLPLGQPGDLSQAHWKSMQWIAVWVVFVFFFVSALDAVYQRYAFVKNLKMSRRDIRQELKDTEGDPMVKGRRRQLHNEWAQQNMLQAARLSSVVVTNPTHIAVALKYEPGDTELPLVTAKGEDYEAQLIREAAEQAGVPVMQNVELARGLYEKVELDQFISAEFFEAVAELLLWAENIRRAR